MAALVAFAAAKLHLRITDDDHDVDIQTAVNDASASIVMRLDTAADPAWTDVTTPLDVQRAIKVLLTHYYEHPGDDMTADEAVWQAVDRVLRQRLVLVVA